MARPREFDPDAALEGAMQVFWSMGYEGASLPDLLDGMALTRGSFYKAYVSKKATFHQALLRYDAQIVDVAVLGLNDEAEPDGLNRIEALFRSVTDAVRNGDVRGCLLCTSGADPSYVSAEIKTVTHDLLDKMRTGFRNALVATPHVKQAEQMSDLLLTNYTGLRILARAQVPVEQLEQSVASLMTVLRS